MGSKLWSVDMLLSQMMIPMRNAYVRGDFVKACHLMHETNDFLIGFNQGITDLPEPPKIINLVNANIRERRIYNHNYLQECKDHYETYSRLVMRKIGAYIDGVFKHLERMQYLGGVSED